MDSQVIIGLLLSALPFFELRVGLPILVEYAVRNGVSIWPFFIAVVVWDILVTFFIFISIDFFHKQFMKWGWYKKRIGATLLKVQAKASVVEKKMDKLGYLALTAFVMIPLPGTGAWTGTLVSWSLGLNRLKSFLAIAAGIVIAGLIVLGLSLGVFVSIY